MYITIFTWYSIVLFNQQSIYLKVNIWYFVSVFHTACGFVNVCVAEITLQTSKQIVGGFST